MFNSQKGSAIRTSLITLAVIAILLVLIVAKLPKGYSDDLSKIGQGKNIVVLIHNKESTTSLTLVSYLDQVRGDYSDTLEFLMLDMQSPEGARFAQSLRLRGATLVPYLADGKRLDPIFGIENVDDLRTKLKKALPL